MKQTGHRSATTIANYRRVNASNAEAASQALGAFSGSTEDNSRDEVVQCTAAVTSSKKRVGMDKGIEIQRILESITDDDIDNLDKFDDFDIEINQLV
jgi:hypothetical protein